MEAIELLNQAVRTLEQNAHFVKAGNPRESVLSAISQLQQVKYLFACGAIKEIPSK
jgi:hypothetical protein